MFLESYFFVFTKKTQWNSIIDATYFQLTLGVIVDIWLLKQYLYLPSMCAAKVYFPLLSRSPEWTIFPSGPVSFVYKVKKCVIKAASRWNEHKLIIEIINTVHIENLPSILTSMSKKPPSATSNIKPIFVPVLTLSKKHSSACASTY